MLAFLISDLANYQSWIRSPIVWLVLAFQIWMFVDAVRRDEWFWAMLILWFPVLTALLYFFMVYRQAGSLAIQGFELPGTHDRRRIKELEAKIHHLDNAHHHRELGDIYFQQGRVAAAHTCFRNAYERDSTDPDIQAHLGQCLLLLQRPQEARVLLEQVCRQNPKHDYGYSLMGLAESQMALGETDAAIAAWEQVLRDHTYARARVQLAALYLVKGQAEKARAELKGVLADDATAPDFQRARERVWVKRAKKTLRTLRV